MGWVAKPSNRSEVLEKSFRPVQMREELLFCLEVRRMHAAPAPTQFDGMFQVQHFVVNDVFHSVGRNPRVIEDAAHDDGIVGGIVVAQPVPSMIAAPSHLGPSQQTIEKSPVQLFKDSLEVVSPALGTLDSLPAAHLTHDVSLPGDVLTRNIAAIPGRESSLDGFAVDLGQQNVSDRP